MLTQTRTTHLIMMWLLLIASVLAVRWLGGELVDPTPQQLVDPTGREIVPAPEGLVGATTALGFLLLGAWLTGMLCERIRLPKLTGYLLFGVLAGPGLYSVLPEAVQNIIPPIIPQDQLDYLRLVNALAISIIALLAGAEIRLDVLRDGLRYIGSITFSNAIIEFLGVTLVLILLRSFIPLLSRNTLNIDWVICMIIGAVAVANSPATVLAMIKEMRSRGPISQIGLAVTVLKDLVLVIIFTILMAIALQIVPGEQFAGEEAAEAPPTQVSQIIGFLVLHLVGSMGIGAGIGILLRMVMRYVAQHMAIFIITIGFGLALVSEVLHLEPLLVALTAGFVLANVFPRHSATLFRKTEELSLPVYCVFFAVAGAGISIEALLGLWPLAALIVGIRIVLLWISMVAANKITPLRGKSPQWMWTALVAQAGVSIALIEQVRSAFGDRSWGMELYSLLLAIVAVHQIIGPPLLRLGLIRAQEAWKY